MIKHCLLVFLLSLLFFFLSLYFFGRNHFGGEIKEKLNFQEDFSEPEVSNVPTSKPQYSVWIPWWEEKRALFSLSKAKSFLVSISPTWYELKKSGFIEEIISSHKKEIINIAGSSSIMILPTIGNNFDKKRVSLFLDDEDIQEKEMQKLINLALSKGYQGWDLDWEEISKEDKDKFSIFVQKFAENLHKKGLLLSVTVHAQTGKASDWEGSKGQDWRALARNADFIRIMAYDFHHSKSEPGPITPLDDLEEVVKYAISSIPISKIVLGLPTYGYDWGEDKGEPLPYQDIIERLREYKTGYKRDKDSFALVGRYETRGVDHVIWFEDKESLIEKIKIGRFFGIYQFCLWSLGGEDINIWTDNLFF